ncbi:restriction endonuclease subunit S domain-containing protein [Micrococcus luteus]|uniref:hypothetical protein n=1 Tax=Micrococcus luteus TaxID=1270 RepID=UPI001D118B2D|nr:hypothetical protein [Micrococcus luteus]
MGHERVSSGRWVVEELPSCRAGPARLISARTPWQEPHDPQHLDEQREIADHLDRETAKIDALISKAERFIELAQERRAALITAAVTGQIEIPTED